MSWIAAKRYYGLARPFDFRVAVPFLANVAALCLVLLIAILFFVNDALSVGTERFYFFCYLVALLSIAAIFSRVSSLSFAAFLWCVAELALALASAAIARRGSGELLLPMNRFTEPSDPRFEYHALLSYVPKAGWRGRWAHDSRNDEYLRREFGWLTTAEYSREATFYHNSLGLRGRELSTDDLAKDLIFIDGGSTTYDYNVTQGSTWVEQLEAALNNRFTIVNFGVPYHTTTQHLIHTAFYQDILGKRPVCAIYYVGWNDQYNTHVKDLDPAYANYYSLLMTTRRPEIWGAKYSPLLCLGYVVAKRRLDSVPEFSPKMKDVSVSDDGRLDRFFIEHVETIAAINSSRNVKTVFIGQVVNRHLLNLTPHSAPSPTVIGSDEILSDIKRLNSLLRRTSVSMGVSYIDVDSENFDKTDFADVVHFSVAGSTKFARQIAGAVEDICGRAGG